MSTDGINIREGIYAILKRGTASDWTEFIEISALVSLMPPGMVLMKPAPKTG